MTKLRISVCSALFVLAACSTDESPPVAAAGAAEFSAVEEASTAEFISPDLMNTDIRPEVGGIHGAVVSGHPLASQIGYEVLRRGGNATDAAVSMAAALAVLRPHMNSVGGDAFALFYEASSKQVTALNASGRAGELATRNFFTDQGLNRVPFSGGLTVTVPGAVSAWSEALNTYGSITFSEALQPAIQLADEGFMVSSTLAADLHNASERLNDAGREIYRPNGEPLRSGEILRSSKLAESLRILADTGPSAMYGGELGRSIAEFLATQGGHLTVNDFAAHTAEWVEPISIPFQGRNVYTVPPNSQGVVLLQMLAMAEHLGFDNMTENSSSLIHRMVEVTKLAFADRDRWVADPDFFDVPVSMLIDSDYLKQRAQQIQNTASTGQASGITADLNFERPNEGGDTVYLMVVDSDGNAVSWIQSLYSTFGSNLVDPDTGIVLQNRGAGFSLEEGHPNMVAPGKRPFHTLMTALVTRGDEFEMTIGTPGGGGQPQFIMQALIQSLVFNFSPQEAVEAPRFRLGGGVELELEYRLPTQTVNELAAMGHDVSVYDGWIANFGSVKIIQRNSHGVLRTGADMRREGAALAY